MSRLYAAQRAMRQARRAALGRGVVAMLDVGSHSVACLVLRFEAEAEVAAGVGPMAGQGRVRVIAAAETRSRGVALGEIVSLPETERAVRTVVQAAQRRAGLRVDHVVACFSGGRPESWGLRGEVPLGAQACDVADVARVLGATDVPSLGEGREALHAQPVNFGVDHRGPMRDPRGQAGEALHADTHLLSVDRHVIEAVLSCLHRCDLEVAGLAFAPYAAATSALVEDEKELGAACVDIGAGTTGLTVFLRRHMVWGHTVRTGGAHVTSDISQGLGVPLTMAEAIKCRWGGVVATGADDREVIPLEGDTGDWHHDRRTITRAELIGIVRPRMEELLEDARAHLDAAGFGKLPGQRIVLTGGGSQMPGLDALAGRILGSRVRLGRPLRVAGLPEMAKGPGWAAAVGLCLQAAEPQDEYWDFDTDRMASGGGGLRRAMRWFRENW